MNGLWFGTDPEAGVVVRTANGRIVWRSVTRIFQDPEKNLAIGLDGQRDTASLEFRPGIHESAEVLIHRLHELVNIAVDYYHPPGVQYRAGAWVEPEPLGGHVHVSWDDNIRPTTSVIRKFVSGMNLVHEYLTARMFPEDDLRLRLQYSVGHERDYARLGSIRPNTPEAAMLDRHIEYRYPPSWMLTPEMAYCYLGTAEVIANLVLVQGVAPSMRWHPIMEAMLLEGTLDPEGGPSLAKSFAVALRHLDFNTDFAVNWQ